MHLLDTLAIGLLAAVIAILLGGCTMNDIANKEEYPDTVKDLRDQYTTEQYAFDVSNIWHQQRASGEGMILCCGR